MRWVLKKIVVSIFIISLSGSCKISEGNSEVNNRIKVGTIKQTSCLEEAAKHYNLDLNILLAIIKAESDFDENAYNSNGNGSSDCGLMQINSIHINALGEDLYRQACEDPCINVWVGAWVYKSCIVKNGYNWNAIGCYHSNTPALRQKYAIRIYEILNEKSGN